MSETNLATGPTAVQLTLLMALQEDGQQSAYNLNRNIRRRMGIPGLSPEEMKVAREGLIELHWVQVHGIYRDSGYNRIPERIGQAYSITKLGMRELDKVEMSHWAVLAGAATHAPDETDSIAAFLGRV